jgi:uncharacterized membrane protein
MKAETLAVWLGIAASLAVVLGYFHARANTATQDEIHRRLAALERKIK